MGCEFVRINPDKEDFDVSDEIGKMYNIIDEIKEKSKNEFIDNIKIKFTKEIVDKVTKRNREVAEGIKELYGL